jgi:hypothetical protein
MQTQWRFQNEIIIGHVFKSSQIKDVVIGNVIYSIGTPKTVN